MPFFEAGLTFGFLGKVSFTLEALGGKPGKGIERPHKVERVEPNGRAEGIGAGFGHCIADLGGGNFVSGLEDVDAWVLAGQAKGQLVANTAFVEQAEFAEVVVIAALFPASDAVVTEFDTLLTEMFGDGAVG